MPASRQLRICALNRAWRKPQLVEIGLRQAVATRQVVTELAGELNSVISSRDFHVFNRCLDEALAGAVTTHARRGAPSRRQSR